MNSTHRQELKAEPREPWEPVTNARVARRIRAGLSVRDRLKTTGDHMGAQAITDLVGSLRASNALNSVLHRDLQAALSSVSTPPQDQIGYEAHEIGGLIAKRDAEFAARLADLTIPPDVSSCDELARSIFGALTDCPSASLDKQADFVARALWPVLSPQDHEGVLQASEFRLFDAEDGSVEVLTKRFNARVAALTFSKGVGPQERLAILAALSASAEKEAGE